MANSIQIHLICTFCLYSKCLLVLSLQLTDLSACWQSSSVSHLNNFSSSGWGCTNIDLSYALMLSAGGTPQTNVYLKCLAIVLLQELWMFSHHWADPSLQEGFKHSVCTYLSRRHRPCMPQRSQQILCAFKMCQKVHNLC